MFSQNTLLVLLLVPSLFSIFHLWSAVQHIFSLGKSKSRLKKERRSQSLLNKVLLWGFVSQCQHYSKKARFIRVIYWCYIIVLCICIIVFCFENYSINWKVPLACSIWGKVILFDIPINLYAFFMTKHDKKHGGVTWVWEAIE